MLSWLLLALLALLALLSRTNLLLLDALAHGWVLKAESLVSLLTAELWKILVSINSLHVFLSLSLVLVHAVNIVEFSSSLSWLVLLWASWDLTLSEANFFATFGVLNAVGWWNLSWTWLILLVGNFLR